MVASIDYLITVESGWSLIRVIDRYYTSLTPNYVWTVLVYVVSSRDYIIYYDRWFMLSESQNIYHYFYELVGYQAGSYYHPSTIARSILQ